MPGPFASVVAASTNDFPGDKNDSIKRWVEANGGKFSKDINDRVTHLICSKKAWKQYTPIVRAARHTRTIAIVNYEWLEDSLTKKSRKPLPVLKYAFEQQKITKVIAAQKKTNRRAGRKKANDAKETSETATNEDDDGGLIIANHRSTDINHNIVEISDDSGMEIDRASSKSDIKTALQAKDEHGETSLAAKSAVSAKTVSTSPVTKTKAKLKIEDIPLAKLVKSEKIEISGREFDAECATFEKDMAISGYRPFVDSNGFVYLMTLVRKDILRNRLEKHRLKVRYASCFAAQTQSSYEMSHENPYQGRYRATKSSKSNDGLVPSIEEETQHPKRSGWKNFDDSWSMPALSPCPVPLFYFPKPYPYSRYPVMSYSHPRSLSRSNPKLRVHIPYPWAQTLQLYEYVPESSQPEGDAKRTKEYACYTVFSRAGTRAVTTLAPPGSTFDFAWTMFRNFFKRKVGVSWEDREAVQLRLTSEVEKEDGHAGGEDGAGDMKFRSFGLLRLKQSHKQLLEFESGATSPSRPSATVVLNASEVEASELHAKARTPESGW